MVQSVAFCQCKMFRMHPKAFRLLMGETSIAMHAGTTTQHPPETEDDVSDSSHVDLCITFDSENIFVK